MDRSLLPVGSAGVASRRAVLCLAASALAALAAVTSSLDGDVDLVPFFVGLTFVAGLLATVVQPPFSGSRRAFARLVAVAWVLLAVFIGGLLVMYQLGWGGSGPLPVPEATYLGLPAVVYHLVAAYLGCALVVVAAFGSPARLDGG